MASTNQHVPEHLWYSIFILLPVKCLLLLRCVCKSWNQVISDNSFIKSHLAHNKASSNTNKYLLLWNKRDPNPALDHKLPYFTTLVDSKTYTNVLESHIHDMHDMFGTDSAQDGLEVYGICDGLLCLSVLKKLLKADSPIFLWNPVIRKAINLNIPTLILLSCVSVTTVVINIVPYRPTVFQVHVYSLSTNRWKKSRINNNIGSSFFVRGVRAYPSRLVNGSAYFLQYPKVNNTGQVAAFFDLSREIIGQINMPDDDYLFTKLEEYGKSVAVMGFGFDDGASDMVIMWILRVADDHSFSWFKKFTIEAKNNHVFVPMGFISTGKLVLKRFIRPKPYFAEYFIYDVENELKLEYTPPVRPYYLAEYPRALFYLLKPPHLARRCSLVPLMQQLLGSTRNQDNGDMSDLFGFST